MWSKYETPQSCTNYVSRCICIALCSCIGREVYIHIILHSFLRVCLLYVIAALSTGGTDYRCICIALCSCICIMYVHTLYAHTLVSILEVCLLAK